MQVVREIAINQETPSEINEITSGYDREIISALIRDLTECMKEHHHTTEISRFVSRKNIVFSGMRKAEVKIIETNVTRVTEDMNVCRHWKKFAYQSLKLTE